MQIACRSLLLLAATTTTATMLAAQTSPVTAPPTATRVLPMPKILGTPMRHLDGMPVSASYSRDGAMLLVCSFGGPAMVFDTHTGETVAKLSGEGPGNGGELCGPKQERAAICFPQDGVRLYTTRTGKQLARLAGAVCLAVAPDGMTAAAGKGNSVLVVDTATLKQLASIPIGAEVVTVAFSSDGKQLVVGTLDGEGQPSDNDKLVDVAQKKVVGEQPAPPLLRRVLPLPDGKTALRHRATGLSATTVERFELPDGPAIAHCDVPLLASSFLVLNDGASLVAGDTDGLMVQVEFATGEVQHRWAAHTSTVSRLLAAPHGQQFVSMSWDGAVKFWNIADGSEQFGSPQHNQAVRAIAFAADGTLVSGAGDGTVIRWGADGAMLTRLANHRDAIVGVAATPAGLWSASLDSTLRLVDAGGKEVGNVPLEGKYAFATAFCSTADGTLISGHRDGTVQWRDGRTGAELRRGDHHRNHVQVVACDASGAQVVSGGVDGCVVFWDPATASPRAKVQAHEEGVRHLYIGPAGQAYSCGEDGDLKQWDVAKGELVRSVTVGEKKPRLDAVAVSAKAGLVVVAAGHRLHCLAIADLAPIGSAELPAGCATLASDADGRLLAAGLDDGTVALFDLAAPAPTPSAAPKPGKAAPSKTKR